jgi:hypothetical protein
MYINRSSTGAVGLFGRMNGTGAEIKNVGVVDCNITGDTRVGAVVGWIYGGGDVTISECFSTGNVRGTRYVGGIAGEAESPSVTVKNCYSTADITGTENNLNVDEGHAGFGGILGYIYAPGAKTTTVINCYSTGNIAGANCAGGIIGAIEVRNVSGVSITVKNSLALNKSVKTTYSNETTENTSGVYTSATAGLRSVSMQNRVVGGIWENKINEFGSIAAYTCNYSGLYGLDSAEVYYHTDIPVSGSKTKAANSPDGEDILTATLTDIASNWTDGEINDAGTTIPAGSTAYFDYTAAAGPTACGTIIRTGRFCPCLPVTLTITVPF